MKRQHIEKKLYNHVVLHRGGFNIGERDRVE